MSKHLVKTIRHTYRIWDKDYIECEEANDGIQYIAKVLTKEQIDELYDNEETVISDDTYKELTDMYCVRGGL